ncbi:nucleoside transporter [Coprinellus micaceus]|uniref:Nucleoside transporter n=1 Tax=Coprinellus micaceus TaxID=71717 RepID=A0A4Y7R5M6_COPMI|nr:nucleoside transporter [Coprinellus micaceus]
MPLPSDSPQALYHSVPQLPEASNSEIALDAEAEDSNPPQDIPPELIDRKIKWISFILGCAVLLPWNVTITAMPYFLARLQGSSLKSTFGSYLTTTFTLSNFIFLAHATITSKHIRPSNRTRSMIIWLTVLNALLTISTFFVPSTGLFAIFVLFNGATQAAAGAYFQTSTIAVASLFGPSAVQAMMSAQLPQTLGKPRNFAGDGSAEEKSAFFFFLLATVFLVVTYFAHEYLVRMPLYARVAGSLEEGGKITLPSEGHQRSVSRARSEVEDSSSVLRVAKANINYEIAVACVFMITLSVFPPITLSIQPTNPTFHPLLFSAVHFLVFNIGDFLGRWVCSFPFMLIWSGKRLLSISIARVLFIPLFLLCNIQRPSSDTPTTPFINSDITFFLILLVFGWSNGYTSSLCMMAAPSVEHNPMLKGRVADVDVAATVASFCLVGGLVLGSIASFAVRSAICDCNPFTL